MDEDISPVKVFLLFFSIAFNFCTPSLSKEKVILIGMLELNIHFTSIKRRRLPHYFIPIILATRRRIREKEKQKTWRLREKLIRHNFKPSFVLKER